MGDIFSGAIWGWVLLTFVVAQLPQFSQAVAMLGAVSARLPFGPVIGVQFANAFTGLVGGTAGNATLVIRFFQKQGLPPAVAVSSGILTSASGFIVQAVLIVIAVVVTGPEFDLSIGSDGDGIPGWLVAVALVVLAVAAVVLLLAPGVRKRRIRDLVETQVRPAWENVRGVLATPRKAVQLFGGNLASQVLYAMVLGAALHAYGGSLPLLQLDPHQLRGVVRRRGGAGTGRDGRDRDRADRRLHRVGDPRGGGGGRHVHGARCARPTCPPIWGWFALSWLRKKDYV